MSITSDEINLLVYWYLKESGFSHSAFVFGHESLVARSSVAEADVPHGSLIGLIQKGLEYAEIETKVEEEADPTEAMERGEGEARMHTNDEMAEGAVVARMDATKIPDEQCQELRGHGGPVFTCVWSPDGTNLATGSLDGTARLWTQDSSTGSRLRESHTLMHSPHGDSGESFDVSAIDWHPEGDGVVTSGSDGIVRVWSKDGESVANLRGHNERVCAVQYNPSGDRLLSAGEDGTVRVWSTEDWTEETLFPFHEGPVLDIAWATDSTFASCSADHSILLCRTASDRPVRRLTGHAEEVNAIQWDASHAVLASCSDDTTVKLWNNKDGLLASLTGHRKEVTAVTWSPTGQGSSNPSKPLRLVSGSYDSSARVWDPAVGREMVRFVGHAGMVYTTEFSPDGSMVATGGADRRVFIWNAGSGELIHSLEAAGAVYEVSWHPDGNSLAAATADSSCTVLDMRMGSRR